MMAPSVVMMAPAVRLRGDGKSEGCKQHSDHNLAHGTILDPAADDGDVWIMIRHG